MFDRDDFERTKASNRRILRDDQALHDLARDFLVAVTNRDQAYQWTWLGLPIIQMPEDILVAQELVWTRRPDVIIETGIAWGGSVAMHASILAMTGTGRLIAVDRVLPDHLRRQLESLPVADRLTLLEGSSTDPVIVNRIRNSIGPNDQVMLVLDSDHTHDHVLSELRHYGPLVTNGQAVIVSDTVLESVSSNPARPRAWGPGNNPHTAVEAFLAENPRFRRLPDINDKLVASYSPGGYLECIG